MQHVDHDVGAEVPLEMRELPQRGYLHLLTNSALPLEVAVSGSIHVGAPPVCSERGLVQGLANVVV